MTRISPEQISLQFQSDRSEFSRLEADLKAALRLQVQILRRQERSASQQLGGQELNTLHLDPL